MFEVKYEDFNVSPTPIPLKLIPVQAESMVQGFDKNKSLRKPKVLENTSCTIAIQTDSPKTLCMTNNICLIEANIT